MKVWILYRMSEIDAEPIAVCWLPFTRFNKTRMDARLAILEHYGMPCRIDAVNEKEVDKWTSPSARRE